MITHITHIYRNNLIRWIVSQDNKFLDTLITVINGLNLMTTVVHIPIIYRRLTCELTIDSQLWPWYRCSDSYISTSTDIEQHLVSATSLYRNRIVIITKHTKSLMRNGKLLCTTWNIKPNFTRLLLCTHNTKWTSIEQEALLRSYNLDQCCGFTVLVHLLCSSGVCSQISFQQFKTYHVQTLRKWRQGSSKQCCHNK